MVRGGSSLVLFWYSMNHTGPIGVTGGNCILVHPVHSRTYYTNYYDRHIGCAR